MQGAHLVKAQVQVIIGSLRPWSLIAVLLENLDGSHPLRIKTAAAGLNLVHRTGARRKDRDQALIGPAGGVDHLVEHHGLSGQAGEKGHGGSPVPVDEKVFFY